MTSAERHEARYQRRKAKRATHLRERLSKYNDFERVARPAAIMRAHWGSRQGVQWKPSVSRYDTNFMKNATKQSRDLHCGKNICTGFYSFTIYERGKRRDVHSLHYAERVVRRSACINSFVPALSNGLIYDNGASLKGKGVSFSINRCVTHLHEYFRETGSNEGYVLLVDFTGYFAHIRHEPLKKNVIDRYLWDKRLNALAKSFIDSANSVLPKESAGIGLFIGPEDSQIFAVSYPNSIDHKIKDAWGIRYYGRYNDDSYIIMRDKKELLRIKQLLFQEYDKLGIIPNKKKTQIVKISRGFTFLKTKFFLTDTGRVILKADHKGIVRERRKLKKVHRFWASGVMTDEAIDQSYMSWRGAILKKDSYRTVKSMDTLFYSLYGRWPWKIKNRIRRTELWKKWQMYLSEWRGLMKSLMRSTALNPR